MVRGRVHLKFLAALVGSQKRASTSSARTENLQRSHPLPPFILSLSKGERRIYGMLSAKLPEI